MNRRVYAYVCIYAFLYPHTSILIRTYAYTYTHIRVYLYAHTRTLTRTYAHTCTHIRVYLYAYYARFLVNVYLSGTENHAANKTDCLENVLNWIVSVSTFGLQITVAMGVAMLKYREWLQQNRFKATGFMKLWRKKFIWLYKTTFSQFLYCKRKMVLFAFQQDTSDFVAFLSSLFRQKLMIGLTEAFINANDKAHGNK